MNLDNLYKAEKQGNLTLLKEIYQENEAVINYFETIGATVQGLIKSDAPDTDKVNSIVSSLQKNLPTLSKIKFLIFEMEEEIPGSLEEKWKKKVKYITKMMSISECETFLKELKDFEPAIEEGNKSRNEIQALYTEVVEANKDKLANFPGLLNEIEIAKASKNTEYEKEFLIKLKAQLEETELFVLMNNLKEFANFISQFEISAKIEDYKQAQRTLEFLAGAVASLIDYLRNISLNELWFERSEEITDPQLIFMNRGNNKKNVQYSYLYTELKITEHWYPYYDEIIEEYVRCSGTIFNLLVGKQYIPAMNEGINLTKKSPFDNSLFKF